MTKKLSGGYFLSHPPYFMMLHRDVCRYTTVRYVTTLAPTNVACVYVTVITMVHTVNVQKVST